MTEQQPEDPATEPDTSTDSGADTSSGTDSGTDSTDGGGSTSDRSELPESEPGEIGDDKLPEDLQPTEDNPLARHPGQTGDEDDKIGADTEGGDADNPSADMTYGNDDDDDDGDDDGPVSAEEDDGTATLDNGGGGAG
jgi:hypothetical protein